MLHRRHGRLLTTLGLLGSLCAVGSGCSGMTQHTRPAARMPVAQSSPQKPMPLLAPRTMVAWSISSPLQQPPQVMAGKDMIGPDGSLCIGPYGTVPVAGLTADQARSAIAKHVAAYVKQPQVEVIPVEAPPAPVEMQQVVAEIGEPRNEALVQRTDEVLQTPVPVAPPAPSGEGKPRTVIASNWRPVERAAPPGFLQPAEWLTARQGQDKPMPTKPADKPADKSAVETPPEQLGTPTLVPGGVPQVPVASIMAPVIGAPIGGPIPGYHHPGAPRELAKVALPPYVIEPPDILLIEYPANEGVPKDFPIAGQHLVRPDGTVGLGVYGAAPVAGLTIDQAKEVIGAQLRTRIKDLDTKNLNVDVLAYNSKFYYVITDGGGYGEQVFRVPVSGSDTVLDAIGQINGLPAVSSKHHIWVARRCPMEASGQRVLKVDWIGITQHGSTETNYQLMPGDRIYVRADKLIKIDTGLAKVLSPVERLFGVTLLGSQTVNSIRTNPNRGTNTGR